MPIVESLRRRRRGLIVGAHGTGKSTLVQTLLPLLASRYPRIVHARFSRDPLLGRWGQIGQHHENARAAIRLALQSPRDGLVIVDGLEQLAAVSRWLFFSTLVIRGCDLLATSHHSLAGCAELYRTGMTPALIRQLATELLAESDPECRQSVWAELDRRDLQRVSDARELWFEMYDVAALNLTRTP